MTMTTERPGLKAKDILIAAGVGIGLTVASYLLAVFAGWISAENVNWFEVGATVLNYGSFYLCVQQRRLYYLIGVAGYVLFVVVYLQSNLLASAALSIYLSFALIVGYFMWGRDSASLPVTRLSWRWLPVYVAVTFAAYLGAVALFSALGGSFTFWDSAILIFTLLAQFMLDRKKIGTWYVWGAVNVIGVVLYFNSELYFIALQQLLFGLANIYGWWEWRKSLADKST